MVIDAMRLVGYLPSHSQLARLKKIIVILNVLCSGNMIKGKIFRNCESFKAQLDKMETDKISLSGEL